MASGGRFDMRDIRILSQEFEADLKDGILSPLLYVVQRDRDLILEIRVDIADIYCKGQRLVRVAPAREGGYNLTSNLAFWPRKTDRVVTKDDATKFVNGELPLIKQCIAMHSKSATGGSGSEIEYEQMMIRANNLEPGVNTDYFAVDRQGVEGDDQQRMDVIAIHWPSDKRRSAKHISIALVEVKHSLGGGVEGLADQLRNYYRIISDNLERIAEQTEGILRQKIRLGLMTSGSKEALDKLLTLPVSRNLEDVRIVVALVDYNPNSSKLETASLESLPFASQLKVFHLGLGLWDVNAKKVSA